MWIFIWRFSGTFQVYYNVMLCAIWCHLYNLKNVKITHGGVLILVKLQALANSRKASHINCENTWIATSVKFWKNHHDRIVVLIKSQGKHLKK